MIKILSRSGDPLYTSSTAATTKAALQEAVGKSLSLRDADLRNADLSGIDLFRVTFEQADLRGASFHLSNLQECSFIGSELDNATFTRANVAQTKFIDCNFPYARFDHAVLYHCFVKKCFAPGSSFDHASLRKFTALRSDLSNASLSGAHLQDESRLIAVRLSGANMNGLKIDQAEVSMSQLDDSYGTDIEIHNSDCSTSSVNGVRWQMVYAKDVKFPADLRRQPDVSFIISSNNVSFVAPLERQEDIEFFQHLDRIRVILTQFEVNHPSYTGSVYISAPAGAPITEMQGHSISKMAFTLHRGQLLYAPVNQQGSLAGTAFNNALDHQTIREQLVASISLERIKAVADDIALEPDIARAAVVRDLVKTDVYGQPLHVRIIINHPCEDEGVPILLYTDPNIGNHAFVAKHGDVDEIRDPIIQEKIRLTNLGIPQSDGSIDPYTHHVNGFLFSMKEAANINAELHRHPAYLKITSGIMENLKMSF